MLSFFIIQKVLFIKLLLLKILPYYYINTKVELWLLLVTGSLEAWKPCWIHPWCPWNIDQHTQATDTHSSWALLANSAATYGLLPSGSNGPPTWPSHRPTATFSSLTAILEVQGRQSLFLPCYLVWLGQERKEKELMTVPWRTPIRLPWHSPWGETTRTSAKLSIVFQCLIPLDSAFANLLFAPTQCTLK